MFNYSRTPHPFIAPQPHARHSDPCLDYEMNPPCPVSRAHLASRTLHTTPFHSPQSSAVSLAPFNKRRSRAQTHYVLRQGHPQQLVIGEFEFEPRQPSTGVQTPTLLSASRITGLSFCLESEGTWPEIL